jgi:hypothetical protein
MAPAGIELAYTLVHGGPGQAELWHVLSLISGLGRVKHWRSGPGSALAHPMVGWARRRVGWPEQTELCHVLDLTAGQGGPGGIGLHKCQPT